MDKWKFTTVPQQEGLRVRPARSSDVASLAQIAHACGMVGWGAASFMHEFTLAWSRCLVAQELAQDANVVGFIVYWQVSDEVEVHSIGVTPSARRRGVGRALMREVVQASRAGAAKRILLEVRSTNTAAIHLYMSLGFVRSGLRKGYYSDTGDDAVCMELST